MKISNEIAFVCSRVSTDKTNTLDEDFYYHFLRIQICNLDFNLRSLCEKETVRRIKVELFVILFDYFRKLISSVT